MPKLGDLRLQNNDLRTLPDSFGASLPQMNKIFLHGNKLESLPRSFTTTSSPMPRLEELSLNSNNLRELPPGFTSGTRDLMFLTLGQNNFSGAVPEQVLTLPKLVGLDLSCNSFSGSGTALVTSLAASGASASLNGLALQDNDFVFGDIYASPTASLPAVALLKSPRLSVVNVLNNTMMRAEGAGQEEEVIRPTSKWPAFDFDDPELMSSTRGGVQIFNASGSNVTFRVVGAYSPPSGQSLATVSTAFDAMMLEPPAGFRARDEGPGRRSCSASTSGTLCGRLPVWGGYGQFGSGATAEREFQTREAHEVLRLRLAVVILDSWDLSDEFVVKVDGRQVWRLDAGRISKREQWCGSLLSWSPDVGLVVADLVVAHTREAAVVELSSTLDEDAFNEAWGLAGAEATLSNGTTAA